MRMVQAVRSFARFVLAIAVIVVLIIGAYGLMGVVSPHLSDRWFHLIAFSALSVVALLLYPILRWGAGVPDGEPF